MTSSMAPLARFSWLFSPNATVPNALPTSQDQEDIARVLLRSWQVLPAVLPKYLQWLGDETPNAVVLARSKAIRALAQLQNQTWKQLSEQFHKERIPYVLLKSGALRWLCYQQPTDRCGFDVDIGVPRRYLQRSQEIVAQQGFQAAQWLEKHQRFERANPILKVLTEMVHYELGFLVCPKKVSGLHARTLQALSDQKEEIPNLWHFDAHHQPFGYVVLDIHHGISREISVDDMVATSRPFTKDSQLFHAPRLAWMAFHLIFKIYWEGVHNYDLTAYQFADLCRLLPLMDDTESEFLIHTLQRWQLVAAGYFVLRRLPHNFETPLPAKLQDFVNQAAKPNRSIKPKDQNDLGDMWGKVWGGR